MDRKVTSAMVLLDRSSLKVRTSVNSVQIYVFNPLDANTREKELCTRSVYLTKCVRVSRCHRSERVVSVCSSCFGTVLLDEKCSTYVAPSTIGFVSGKICASSS